MKKKLFGRERSGSKQGPSVAFGCLMMEVLKVFSCGFQTYTDFSAIRGGWRAVKMRLKGKTEATEKELQENLVLCVAIGMEDKAPMMQNVCLLTLCPFRTSTAVKERILLSSLLISQKTMKLWHP